ncbi:MAG: hypothetical protein N3B13_12210, partial [Deltaproteobacteria bacterium]|nr:hypothetical protein [Deltaproteobacteria bacterium]
MKRFLGCFLLFLLLAFSLQAAESVDFIKIMKQSNPEMKIRGRFYSNSPVLITDLSERFNGTSATEVAKAFIEKYNNLFLAESDMGYKLDKVAGGKDLRTVRFRYTYKGFDVFPAGIAVTVDGLGRVHKTSFVSLSPASLDTRVSFNREDAYYLVVNKYAPFSNIAGSKYTTSSVKEVVLLIGKKAFFAYEVKVASFASLTNVSYFIDAKTGKLLYKKNNVVNLNKAKVYYPNPGVDGKNPTVEVDIENLNPNVTDKTLTGTLIRSTNCYGKGEQKEWQIPQYQATMKFSICNIGPKATSDENGDFYFTPDDPVKCFEAEDSQACFESVMEDDFAEVMMYYHANKMYTYFKGKGFEKINTNSGL